MTASAIVLLLILSTSSPLTRCKPTNSPKCPSVANVCMFTLENEGRRGKTPNPWTAQFPDPLCWNILNNWNIMSLALIRPVFSLMAFSTATTKLVQFVQYLVSEVPAPRWMNPEGYSRFYCQQQWISAIQHTPPSHQQPPTTHLRLLLFEFFWSWPLWLE